MQWHCDNTISYHNFDRSVDYTQPGHHVCQSPSHRWAGKFCWHRLLPDPDRCTVHCHKMRSRFPVSHHHHCRLQRKKWMWCEPLLLRRSCHKILTLDAPHSSHMCSIVALLINEGAVTTIPQSIRRIRTVEGLWCIHPAREAIAIKWFSDCVVEMVYFTWQNPYSKLYQQQLTNITTELITAESLGIHFIPANITHTFIQPINTYLNWTLKASQGTIIAVNKGATVDFPVTKAHRDVWSTCCRAWQCYWWQS